MAGQAAGEIIRLLEAYRPDSEEQDLMRAKFLSFLADCPDPCNRRNFNPGHLTASTIVLEEGWNDILLVRHGTLKRWLQPGGHVEAQDATLAGAAVRELLEEAGIVVDAAQARLFDLDIHHFPGKADEPEHLHFDVRFLVVTAQTKTTWETEEAETRWFPLNDPHGAADLDRILAKCLHFRP